MKPFISGAIGKWLFAGVVAFFAVIPAWGQSEREVRVSVHAGTPTLVDSAGCIKNVTHQGPGSVDLVSAGGRTHIIFTPPPGLREDQTITADLGQKESADHAGCEPPVNRQYTLTFSASPEVSAAAVQTSFTVLVAALVLALLLENAFALLFNWRLFNVFLVGRMVRTPIMFAAALLVVRQFDFDLMARMFDAYYPPSKPSISSWGTSILTAMILAGGSVGVNRILTSLGFRLPVRDADAPKLDESHAWLAVEVQPGSRGGKALVAVTEITYDGLAPVRTAVGIAGTQRPSLKSLFNGDMWRVPRSGGIEVDTGKYYTITAQDFETGTIYDVTGKPIPEGGRATIFRFGPRSVLDFRIRLPEKRG